jgi:hypothetical protein
MEGKSGPSLKEGARVEFYSAEILNLSGWKSPVAMENPAQQKTINCSGVKRIGRAR